MRLIAQNLCVERGGRRLATGVSFTLGPGEALLLTGANGSGKTSLLRAICGLLPLAEGTVAGEDLRPGESLGESCHFIGHDNALKARMTVGENLSFWAGALDGVSGEPALRAALAKVGLQQAFGLFAGALSAGQRRRVALCRALVAKRSLWLLDEPTTALDSASVAALASLIAEHRQTGGLVIAATHAEFPLPGAQALHMGQPTKAAA
jgi:heme exporter protein A